MMVKRYIIFLYLTSLTTFSFTTTAFAESQGFFDESYHKSVQTMSPEELESCEEFTEWASKEPSSTVTDILLQKSTLTLRCGFAHKSNKLRLLVNKYEKAIKNSTTDDLGYSALQFDQNPETEIPAYFLKRMSPDECTATIMGKKPYSASAKVGSLSKNKFSINSYINVEAIEKGKLRVSESLYGSLFGEKTERSFVINPQFIRTESEWTSSIDNSQSVLIKSSKELPTGNVSEIEVVHRTGGRRLKATGQARTKYLGCMNKIGGGSSNLIQVDQLRIYPILKAARDKNPNSRYSPLGSITYFYEVDNANGFILAYAELDYTGNSIHLISSD